MSVAVASSRAPSTTVVGLLALSLLGLYASIGHDLVVQWSDDPNYSHGFLVPIFSGYLLWQRRADLRCIPLAPNFSGLAILLSGLAVLVIGEMGAENYLARSSLLLVVAGLVVFHLGSPMLRGVAFPLAYLLFMIPLPQVAFNAVAFPLQTFAAENATSVLDLLGVAVLRDGNVIHLSRITLGVTEACSGIRSLVSLLALAVASAHLSLTRRDTMLLLVASAVPITIVANAARIVITGLIGQWVGARYAEGFFHAFSGWLIFFVAFLLLFAVQFALSRFETRGGDVRSRDE